MDKRPFRNLVGLLAVAVVVLSVRLVTDLLSKPSRQVRVEIEDPLRVEIEGSREIDGQEPIRNRFLLLVAGIAILVALYALIDPLARPSRQVRGEIEGPRQLVGNGLWGLGGVEQLTITPGTSNVIGVRLCGDTAFWNSMRTTFGMVETTNASSPHELVTSSFRISGTTAVDYFLAVPSVFPSINSNSEIRIAGQGAEMVNLSINESTYSRIAAVEPSLQDPLSQPASIEIPGHTPISTHLRGGDGCEYVDMKLPSGFRPSPARLIASGAPTVQVLSSARLDLSGGSGRVSIGSESHSIDDTLRLTTRGSYSGRFDGATFRFDGTSRTVELNGQEQVPSNISRFGSLILELDVLGAIVVAAISGPIGWFFGRIRTYLCWTLRRMFGLAG